MTKPLGSPHQCRKEGNLLTLELTLNKREELALEAILSALDDALDVDDGRDTEICEDVALIRRRVAVALAHRYRAQPQIFKKGKA